MLEGAFPPLHRTSHHDGSGLAQILKHVPPTLQAGDLQGYWVTGLWGFTNGRRCLIEAPYCPGGCLHAKHPFTVALAFVGGDSEVFTLFYLRLAAQSLLEY